MQPKCKYHIYDVQQTLVWYCNILGPDYRDICWDTNVTPPRESPFHIFEPAWEWGSGEGGAAPTPYMGDSVSWQTRVWGGGQSGLSDMWRVTVFDTYQTSNFCFNLFDCGTDSVRRNQSADMRRCQIKVQFESGVKTKFLAPIFQSMTSISDYQSIPRSHSFQNMYNTYMCKMHLKGEKWQ